MVVPKGSYGSRGIERGESPDAAAAAWRLDAHREALAVAQELADKFGATRVLLFGSVARGEGAPGSDIDLLVAGIAPMHWFAACAVADRVARVAYVDMAPWPGVRPSVLERALSEGEVLLG